ncbi:MULTISPECIES: zinc-dependent metalloprotease [Bifidobacterium]|uniref:Hydrolase domain protein n=1 Tax=Bifidobacterium reuteri DSM 23975 TaxID=1437610 RepID=A0A087CVI8_9BIFI|nr:MULTISPECIES: zinc-dependent metalloprotease [Bifidobacterium]KFI87288.1 hydrolase domain protein [Bifidobacterium reuteri DSM 23975]TPF77345.1 hydrolase [Bifidobacterium sp. UTCIF-1]TPF79317.1 hydrolase [Bifidobacterium sp. UTCIF-24]TPF81864.1 hydrolase [Bifidobacterium sp. UTCIF-3]TPF83457.1 hydrolase [Bifidobacterium sp. UTCIF-36]
MDDNAIHEWLIKCFGPIQGEMAWQQISQLPEEIREQLMSQDPSRLPDPSEVQQMMAAFSAGGLNTMSDMQRTVEEGPINVKLAKSIALQQANASGSESSVSAVDGEAARRAMSEANLWLDTACEFNPAPGEPDVLTRAGWVEGTIDQWAKFASPVAESMNDALASVISERLGGMFGDGTGEIAGMFAGPVPIPIPDGMKDPAQLMKLLGNTSFAMQLGHAAGNLSHEVHGSFDQGIALLQNPAGGLIAQNATEYAAMLNGQAQQDPIQQDTAGDGSNDADSHYPAGFTSAQSHNSDTNTDSDAGPQTPSEAGSGDDASDADDLDAQFAAAFADFNMTEHIPESEVLSFLALQEMAHARLYASVPWLMPRFEALIGKYARGISIDLDAMEEQLRDATSMDPESISGAVNLTKVGIPDTPEQREALASLESLLAMVEGWVDCVVWRAGMAHLPHIEQLREMMRRERAMGGPAERTFESLLGMQLRPKRMREAAGLWEMITAAEGPEGRDAKWSHPDLLPTLPAEQGAGRQDDGAGAGSGTGASQASSAGHPAAEGKSADIDWDAELSKLLDEDGDKGGNNDNTDHTDGTDQTDGTTSGTNGTK